MVGLANALVIVAVVTLVLVRQFRARPIDTDRRWWLLPLILGVIALREPGILDAHHRVGSAALLAVELLIGLAMGAGWAWTTHVWTEPDGAVWSKGTKASAAVWVAGIALRMGLFAIGAALGLHQHSSALLLGFAASLLVRAGILTWRASTLGARTPLTTQPLGATSRPAAAYGDGRPAGEERL
ncbi:DUF1453 family protein [Streptomyces griseofuscus]|uniref:DUF1453 family protein n=1 Tax=Streptomyces TaxID=1883 RepID=UPI0018F074A4|nr:DUF1453 family protein [Streptomyces sp. CRPSP2-6A1]MBJ7003876.1 DUF1453 family protein [Streptomyces sp. CRPSP2-6A1]